MREFEITEEEKLKLCRSIEKARLVPAPENSLGQWIGNFIDAGAIVILDEVCEEISMEGKTSIEAIPKKGDGLIKIKNTLGQFKQIDHVIRREGKNELIVEVKWLKDQRHLNDKGAWVLMMTDILIENKELKGIIAILAGPWEAMRKVIEKRAKVIIIPISNVYNSLSNRGINITIDTSRNAYENPGETLNAMLNEIENKTRIGQNLLEEVGYEILSPYKSELKEKILSLFSSPTRLSLPY